MKEKTYKLLDQGYFVFPMMQIGKRFIVEDTITTSITDERWAKLFEINKGFNFVFPGIIAEVCWKTIKKNKLDKKYKNYWLSPVRIDSSDKEITIDFDLLKPVKRRK